MKKIITFTFFIFCSLWTYAQVDTLYVGKTYWQRQGRADVPEWFLSSGQDTVVAVSDGCLKPEVACEQAVQRAMFVYALSKGVEVNIVSDFFTMYKETLIFQSHKDKYISMANFQISMPAMAYEVIDTAFTKYGEAIARVRFYQDTLVTGDMLAFAQMMLINNNDRRETIQTYINLEIETSQLPLIKSSKITHTMSNSAFDFSTEINETPLKITKDGYWYNEIGNSNTELCGRNLRYSIWHSFLDNLVFEIINYPYLNIINKQMDDNYQEVSNEKGKIYNIVRSVAKEKIQLKCKYNSIYDNKLYVEWIQ